MDSGSFRFITYGWKHTPCPQDEPSLTVVYTLFFLPIVVWSSRSEVVASLPAEKRPEEYCVRRVFCEFSLSMCCSTFLMELCSSVRFSLSWATSALAFSLVSSSGVMAISYRNCHVHDRVNALILVHVWPFVNTYKQDLVVYSNWLPETILQWRWLVQSHPHERSPCRATWTAFSVPPQPHPPSAPPSQAESPG